MTSQDQYGYFGPEYSFADNIKLPGQVGVRRESSFSAIIDAVGGINYYVDTIAFGGPTFFDKSNPQPMGIRYYLNTEMRCSNGATMSEYFDGVTKGNLFGDRIAKGLESSGLPGLKGLAPGMLENARDALDPRPILSAVTGSGYPVCQQVVCPVGDINGNIASDGKPFIVDSVQYATGQGPTQKRWVQAYDAKGFPLNITKDKFGATPKCYNADGTYKSPPGDGCPAKEPAATALPGTNKISLCKVVQPAPSVEGFLDAGQGLLFANIVALGFVVLLIARL